MVCVDAKSRVIAHQIIHRGSVNVVEANIRKIANIALHNNAAGILLAHNHPGGIALPSPEDIATTRNIKSALLPMGIVLMDHIIVAGEESVSMALSGVDF